jgi:hypothetical protein
MTGTGITSLDGVEVDVVVTGTVVVVDSVVVVSSTCVEDVVLVVGSSANAFASTDNPRNNITMKIADVAIFRLCTMFSWSFGMTLGAGVDFVLRQNAINVIQSVCGR